MIFPGGNGILNEKPFSDHSEPNRKEVFMSRFVVRSIIGFIAGFIAVLLFHQGMLALLHAMDFTARTPFPMQPTQPFGVPQIWSLAFWGGIWGIVFAAFFGRTTRGAAFWIGSLLFGAIGPTLIAWFVVSPMKGQPIAAGWKAIPMITGILVNAAWGIGTALFYRGLAAWWRIK
jgi:hypothetical protein